MGTSLRLQNGWLYAGTLAMAVFLMTAALGPGLFREARTGGYQWQYMIFRDLCHQDPARSFTFYGVQMAVCARCLGIYGAFLIGCLTMPLYILLSDNSTGKEKYWLIAAILLNLADVVGNYFGLWTNTHIFRLTLGGVFGWCVTILLANEFFTLNKSE